jgi:hypothetical protein
LTKRVTATSEKQISMAKKAFAVRGNIDAARAIRDGGIDAVAALDSALGEALAGTPAKYHEELKLAFGRAMADILETTVDAAVRAFPELYPDQSTWVSVVKSRASMRSKTALSMSESTETKSASK